MERSKYLGRRAKDTLTGWEGVVTVHSQHLTGCDVIGIGGGLDKDDKPRESQWFDINRIELLDGEAWAPVEVESGSKQSANEHGAWVTMPTTY